MLEKRESLGFRSGAVLAMQRAGEPRNLACRGVAMERAFARGLIEHPGRLAQLLLGSRGVGALNRLYGMLDRAVYAGLDRTIAVAPLEALPMALLC